MQPENNGFAQGLQDRAMIHINEALQIVNNAINSQFAPPPPPPVQHPAYLHALADLRAARWMLSHRPGNWQVSVDENEAIRRIEAAIHEIKIASIDDGKDIEDHVGIDERPDHGGRLHAAADFLAKAQQDVMQPENNGFAQGLQQRAMVHINEALRIVNNAINSQFAPPPPPPMQHPAYLHALADLRAARWMLSHRPGNWQVSVDENEAIRRIEAAIHEIKIASIDDGKDIEDHVGIDERPDHGGRLHAAADFLAKAKQDVMQPENNGFAQGLQQRAMVHINEALRIVEIAIHTVH